MNERQNDFELFKNNVMNAVRTLSIPNCTYVFINSDYTFTLWIARNEKALDGSVIFSRIDYGINNSDCYIIPSGMIKDNIFYNFLQIIFLFTIFTTGK